MDGIHSSSRARSALLLFQRLTTANDNRRAPSETPFSVALEAVLVLIVSTLVPAGTGVNFNLPPHPGLAVPSDTDMGGTSKSGVFVERLLEAFEESGATQGEVARAVNALAGTHWTSGYFGRLLTSKRPAKVTHPEVVFALADVLHVNARWLWTGKGPKRALLGAGNE
jgi:hypothetical protein